MMGLIRSLPGDGGDEIARHDDQMVDGLEHGGALRVGRG
jgi:hypothetical protein